MRKFVWPLVIAASLVGVGCSSSDNKTNAVVEAPVSSTVPVTAAAGGTVKAGSASLVIPAGALPADTQITVTSAAPAESLPAHDSLLGNLYEFGPNGTKFTVPAALELPLPAAAPEGKKAVMSWLDTTTNKWVDLESTVSGSVVKANVMHFTSFIIRLVDASGTPVGGELDCSFAACGGDVGGTWKIAGACADKIGDNSFSKDCPEAVVKADVVASGSVTFGADGTMTSSMSIGGSAKINFPTTCLTKMGATCGNLGDSLAKQGGSCSAATDSCDCNFPLNQDKADQTKSDTGTYSVSGNTLITTSTKDNSTDTLEYCVTGNTMRAKSSDGTLIVLSR